MSLNQQKLSIDVGAQNQFQLKNRMRKYQFLCIYLQYKDYISIDYLIGHPSAVLTFFYLSLNIGTTVFVDLFSDSETFNLSIFSFKHTNAFSIRCKRASATLESLISFKGGEFNLRYFVPVTTSFAGFDISSSLDVHFTNNMNHRNSLG